MVNATLAMVWLIVGIWFVGAYNTNWIAVSPIDGFAAGVMILESMITN